MRQSFVVVLILMSVFILGAVAIAENQLGIADTYQVTFSEKVRVADTLLPKGDYEIRHVMEGENHIMVFHQLKTRKLVEVRAKCTLVPLSVKANQNQTTYVLNAANERVLQELVFKGDRAKHVF
jgi:hypothetical protein